MSNFGDQMLPWLQSSLSQAYRRHNVLTGNIANADTPEYVPRDIEFTSYLSNQLDGGGFNDSRMEPEALARPGAEIGLDGNRVDIEDEMMKLAANKLLYQLVATTMQKKMALIRYAIDEGGR
jgi:flagellar basal-body rod protein FlgB